MSLPSSSTPSGTQRASAGMLSFFGPRIWRNTGPVPPVARAASYASRLFFFLLISLHKHANTSGRAFLDPEGLGVGRFCYQLTPAAVLHDDPSKSPLLGLPNVEAVPIAGPVLSSLKVQ